MGKVKRREQVGKASTSKHGKQNTNRRQHSQILPSKVSKGLKSSANGGAVVQANHRPKVPFTRHDRVLLIGEGDMSFALSLIKHHKPKSVTATCYDTREQLLEKYPNVMSTIAQLDPSAVAEAQATKASLSETDHKAASGSSDEFEGFSPTPSPTPPLPTPASSIPTPSTPQTSTSPFPLTQTNVLYAINATKLSTPHHQKLLRPHGPFTKIVFNFPHVGGLSTDVNRQVRANQELLVKFFEAAKPLLLQAAQQLAYDEERRSAGRSGDENGAGEGERSERYSTPPSSPSSSSSSSSSLEASDNNDHPLAQSTTQANNKNSTDQQHPIRPQLLTTLFTSAPYTLWNIRDLARHCGYNVVESFRFPWEAYPGYRHARTLGDLVEREPKFGNGEDTRAMGKGKGRWRGEEREARCFVMEVRDDDRRSGGGRGRGGGGGGGRGGRGRGGRGEQNPRGIGKRKRGDGGGSNSD